MEPEQYAKAALEIYLNNPAATLENVVDDEEISLEKALREDAMGYPENPWLQKAARTAPAVHDDSKSRRHEVLKTFLREKLNEGFTTEDVARFAAKHDAGLAAEFREIGMDLEH